MFVLVSISVISVTTAITPDVRSPTQRSADVFTIGSSRSQQKWKYKKILRDWKICVINNLDSSPHMLAYVHFGRGAYDKRRKQIEVENRYLDDIGNAGWPKSECTLKTWANVGRRCRCSCCHHSHRLGNLSLRFQYKQVAPRLWGHPTAATFNTCCVLTLMYLKKIWIYQGFWEELTGCLVLLGVIIKSVIYT